MLLPSLHAIDHGPGFYTFGVGKKQRRERAGYADARAMAKRLSRSLVAYVFNRPSNACVYFVWVRLRYGVYRSSNLSLIFVFCVLLKGGGDGCSG